jgi:hypothetical protein
MEGLLLDDLSIKVHLAFIAGLAGWLVTLNRLHVNDGDLKKMNGSGHTHKSLAESINAEFYFKEPLVYSKISSQAVRMHGCDGATGGFFTHSFV